MSFYYEKCSFLMHRPVRYCGNLYCRNEYLTFVKQYITYGATENINHR